MTLYSSQRGKDGNLLYGLVHIFLGKLVNYFYFNYPGIRRPGASRLCISGAQCPHVMRIRSESYLS